MQESPITGKENFKSVELCFNTVLFFIEVLTFGHTLKVIFQKFFRA